MKFPSYKAVVLSEHEWMEIIELIHEANGEIKIEKYNLKILKQIDPQKSRYKKTLIKKLKERD